MARKQSRPRQTLKREKTPDELAADLRDREASLKVFTDALALMRERKRLYSNAIGAVEAIVDDYQMLVSRKRTQLELASATIDRLDHHTDAGPSGEPIT